MITLMNEKDILSIAYRMRIIGQITGSENIERKRRELRKHEILKDRTKKHVIDSLAKELSAESVQLMQNRASNISIMRKIVDKKAKAYTAGVFRKGQDDADTESITIHAKLTKANSILKKTDKYLQAFKNCLYQVMPEKDNVESTIAGRPKFKIKHRVLPPYKYDVIPDHFDQEKIRCVILTDFIERGVNSNTSVPAGEDGRSITGPAGERGDGREQDIANEPSDKGKQHRTFIWWSDAYHFTTDDKAQIMPELSGDMNKVSGERTDNPIGALPFVNFAEDQDGSFWAEGGEDLVDGAILVNVNITDMFSIASVQGWGQLVATGKNLPEHLKVGPHRGLVFNYDTGDPVPNVSYITSNPPLDLWMRMIEQYVALLLSTNNLSTRNIAGSLSANDIASGISKIIDQSDSTDDVTESQADFQEKEPQIWFIEQRWYDKLAKTKHLNDEFTKAGTFKNHNVLLEFPEQKPIITEADKLENLKRRKDLGINTQLQLVKLDNPNKTDQEAEKLLLEIQEEKLKSFNRNIENAINNSLKNGSDESEESENQDDSEESEKQPK